MKNLAPYLILGFFLFPLAVQAQQSLQDVASMNKWEATQFNFGLGVDNDHYADMSLDHILAFAKDPNAIKYELDGWNENVSTVAYGASLYLNVGLSPLDPLTGTYRPDREWQVGLAFRGDREAMVTYEDEETTSTIVFCTLQSEIDVESAYLFKGQWGKRWNWYYGLGLSAGTSLSSEVLVIRGNHIEPEEHPSAIETEDPVTESYAGRSVLYSRAYIPYGIHYQLGQNWQFGLDLRTGLGVQAIEGEEADFIKKTGSFILGASYRIQ